MKEIWYRSDNDATCTKCFKKAEYDRMLADEIKDYYSQLKKE